MSALTFDTLAVARELTEGGLTEQHAEAVTRAIRKAQEAHLEELATKGDIIRVEGEMKLMRWILAANSAGIFALLLKAFFSIG